MRTPGTRKYGRRSREASAAIRRAVGTSHAWPECGCAVRSVSDRSSSPLHAVSICPHRRVVVGYRQGRGLGGGLRAVHGGGRVLSPVPSVSRRCSVQSTHEYIVKEPGGIAQQVLFVCYLPRVVDGRRFLCSCTPGRRLADQHVAMADDRGVRYFCLGCDVLPWCRAAWQYHRKAGPCP